MRLEVNVTHGGFRHGRALSSRRHRDNWSWPVAVLGSILMMATTLPPCRAGEAATAATPPAVNEGPSGRIVAAESNTSLRQILEDLLARNPAIASANAQALADAEKASQVKALPDPLLNVTAFPLSPETRVGPQQAMFGVSQKFPWFGKLKLREKAASEDAMAARALVEAKRLSLITEARRLYDEIGFLTAYERVLRSDRDVLSHYEELARTRYASGVGLEQAVVKLQAEITRDETRLLDLARQRATLVSTLNSLRDMPSETPIPTPEIPIYPQLSLNVEDLKQTALASRPEIAEADARIERAKTMFDLAGKDYDPDVTFGLSYTLVGGRTDAAGLAMPPPDNGKNILGISATFNLPVWKEKLGAGVEETVQRQLAARSAKRSIVTAIDRDIGDLLQRIPLTWDQLHLFADVLAVQAEESLRSAEAGYAAGTHSALDLLDAERVLLDVRTGTERARADYAIAIARLEGAIGALVAESVKKGEVK
ncbi:MAG: TolC family protein [Acidobacteria bacterium]|nr:TolC family protein [Acidobacteriota bacterium]